MFLRNSYKLVNFKIKSNQTNINVISCLLSSFSTSALSSSEIINLYKQSLQAIQNNDRIDKSTSNTPIVNVSNENKLKLYSLFKQIEVGPCNINKPGIFDPVGRAKYEAWYSLGNMNKENAMKSYIDAVSDIYNGKIPITKSSDHSDDITKVVTKMNHIKKTSIQNIAYPNQLASHESDNVNSIINNFETIIVNINENGIVEIKLNRPKKGNSFDIKMWNELTEIFGLIKSKSISIKTIILSGNGGNFSTGMDLNVFSELQKLASKESCEGRRREGLMKFIEYLQEAISGPETCGIPVIAAITGNCIGGAVDMITACDMRYCTADARFCVKEIDLAIVADIGTLQRLPRIIGEQRAYDLCYTGRTITGKEAELLGLVLKCFETENEMMDYVNQQAHNITTKSPLTIRGIKETILYSREHTVKESLHQVKMWNTAFLFSDDLLEAMTAIINKKTPIFKGK